MRCPPSLVPAFFIFIASLTLAGVAPAASKFDLTPAQKERLAKYLPHTYPKLVQHAPVHVTLLGDSVTGMYVHDDDDSNLLKSYGGVFVSALADQFYYTGGARMERPAKGKPEKILDIHGPEIVVHNASRGGKLMIHAMNLMETVAWSDSPDLVIVNFGINDANAGFRVGEYRRALQELIKIVRSHGADIILLGSTLTVTDPPEFGLALTRPYVDTVHEVADANGIFFADLGDLAWLVRIDEPMKGLEKPTPKKSADAPAADATPPAPEVPTKGTEGATPGAIVSFPYADELDPDPDKRAARLFHALMSDLRAWYDHGSQSDFIHPNTHLHKLLGRRLYSELVDGPRKVPWAIGAGTAEFKDANTFTLTYRVENTTDELLRVSVLPLVTQAWKPQDAETQLELKPGRKGQMTVTYARVSMNGETLPFHEEILRLPIMVLSSGVARIEQVRSLMQPCAVLWDVGAKFNVEDNFAVTAQIVNTNGDDLNGTWEAEWLGQKFGGKINVPAHKSIPVVLHLKLPDDASKVTRERGTLAFSVTAHGITLPFNREIEAARNLGLKETVPLLTPEQYLLNQPQAARLPDSSHPGVTLRVDADPNALYFTWDFIGMNLIEDAAGHAVICEMNLDARSYGKRLGNGVTDAIRMYAGSADGEGTVPNMQPWCFGNGYGNQRIDAGQVQSHLSSRPDGSRRFTLMFPRSFFYLHEWALGNGNSQMGFNMTLLVHQKGDDKNPQGAFTPYAYSLSPLYRDEALTLAALELTEHPTKRWTIHFY